MLIGVAEGAVRSFEIDERAEGYLVRPRQRDTGQVEIEAGRVFRTAVAAFAFAEREALLEHYAAARLEGGPEGAMRSPATGRGPKRSLPPSVATLPTKASAATSSSRGRPMRTLKNAAGCTDTVPKMIPLMSSSS